MEMDPNISAFTVTADEEYKIGASANTRMSDEMVIENKSVKKKIVPLVSVPASAANLCSGASLNQGEDTESKSVDSVEINLSSVEDNEGRKPSGRLKNHPGKRKVKVDWTPELHRRFVEAVERLGVDKAVPSKILELMGVDCLTRHNIASHLQKYRRKHLLTREAEASTWSRRQQICGTTEKIVERNVNYCTVPTTGFPPVESVHHFTPLHVWGHPHADQSVKCMWSNPIASLPPPPPVWLQVHHPPPPPPGNTSSWYYPHQDVPALGMPCFPHYASMRFDTPPVTGVPPMYMYRVEPDIGVPIVPSGRTFLSHPQFDSPPSEQTIDAVIGHVLSKPWLPLPLGLKPPPFNGIMVELQRQGIAKIPSQCK